MADDLGMAAIDPNSAIKAELPSEQDPIWWLSADNLAPVKRHPVTMAVTVRKPLKHSRWRFFLFWVLVKLAARVYPFNFELYREPEPGDDQ